MAQIQPYAPSRCPPALPVDAIEPDGWAPAADFAFCRLAERVEIIFSLARMRAVIQRVSQAAVAIGGQRRAEMGPGLLVLLGIEEGDTENDIVWLSGKIVRLRIFSDPQGLMNRSVQEAGGELLVISQFTLFASTHKGNRPSFSRAARPESAIPLYEAFVRRAAVDLGKPVATGVFGAMMQVSLVNDGPVTIVIDTRWRE